MLFYANVSVIDAEFFKGNGAHLYPGDIKDKSTPKFNQKHNFDATILASRRYQNSVYTMSNPILREAQILKSLRFVSRIEYF